MFTKKMKTLMCILHPLFCWGAFVFLGLEAMRHQLYLPIIIIAVGLCGLSQNYWKQQIGSELGHTRGELISFGLGLLAAIAYPFLIAWYFFYKI